MSNGWNIAEALKPKRHLPSLKAVLCTWVMGSAYFLDKNFLSGYIFRKQNIFFKNFPNILYFGFRLSQT